MALKKQRKVLEIACVFLRVLERPRIMVVADDCKPYEEAFDMALKKYGMISSPFMVDGKPISLFPDVKEYVNLLVVDGEDIDIKMFDNVNRACVDMLYCCTNVAPGNIFAFTNEHKSHATQRYDWGAEYLLLKRDPKNDDPRKIFETLAANR